VRFLHRFLSSASGSELLKTHLDKVSPDFRQSEPASYAYAGGQIEETDFGVWANGRPGFVLPSFCLTGGGPQGARGDGYMLYWRVPIDDTRHWLFIMAYKASGPIDADRRHGWSTALVGSDHPPYRNRSNRYLQDREEQRTATFTGMGPEFPPHDACVNEGAGPIQNRTREHLGAADQHIIACRKLMLRSIEMIAGGLDPPGLIRDLAINRTDPLFLKQNAAPIGVPQ
jgi:hypothetical protein